MVELKTKFWRKAAERLPEAHRERYIGYLKRAEDFELALDAIEDVALRVRNIFRAPRHA